MAAQLWCSGLKPMKHQKQCLHVKQPQGRTAAIGQMPFGSDSDVGRLLRYDCKRSGSGKCQRASTEK
eukprot:scaffold50797_cov19-Tisochrysis_lutea.AAC.1